MHNAIRPPGAVLDSRMGQAGEIERAGRLFNATNPAAGGAVFLAVGRLGPGERGITAERNPQLQR